MDRRNAALVATLALFGKRVSEVLAVQMKDIVVDDHRLSIRFHTLKEFSPAKVVCQCQTINRASWKFCKVCGTSLEGRPVIQKTMRHEQRLLFRSREHPLVNYVVSWVSEASTLTQQNFEAYLFPPSDLPGIFGTGKPDWSQHLGRRMALIVVKSVDPALWCHLFRHQLATRFSEQGYDETHLMDWFDWKKYETAHRYVRLGGGRRIMEMGTSDA